MEVVVEQSRFILYSIIDGNYASNRASESAIQLSIYRFCFPLDRPRVSADHSEVAGTDEEEDDVDDK